MILDVMRNLFFAFVYFGLGAFIYVGIFRGVGKNLGILRWIFVTPLMVFVLYMTANHIYISYLFALGRM